MKALTVRQPWAWLIVHGHKSVEHRTWTTSYRGPLAILASKQLHAETVADGYLFAAEAGITLPSHVDCGGIVGMVVLVDIIPCDDDPGCYQWLLRNSRPVPFQACKGGLGLRNVKI